MFLAKWIIPVGKWGTHPNFFALRGFTLGGPYIWGFAVPAVCVSALCPRSAAAPPLCPGAHHRLQHAQPPGPSVLQRGGRGGGQPGGHYGAQPAPLSPPPESGRRDKQGQLATWPTSVDVRFLVRFVRHNVRNRPAPGACGNGTPAVHALPRISTTALLCTRPQY